MIRNRKLRDLITNPNTKFISTWAMAARYNVSTTRFFSALKKLGYIKKVNNKWEWMENEWWSTAKFIEQGSSRVLVWPETYKTLSLITELSKKLVNVETISQHFNTTPERILDIFLELGWIKKESSGWVLTEKGRKKEGDQIGYSTGITKIVWPDSILRSVKLHSFFKEEIAIAKQLRLREQARVQFESYLSTKKAE